MGKWAARAQQDLELWQTWKQDPTPENLEPLLNSLQPVINRKLSEFRAAPVPPSAIQGAANLTVMKALNSYNPDKGASVATHVGWNLKKVRAYVIKHQNMGRIPEHRAYNIQDFKDARADLTARMGFPPDAQTLAEELGWSLAEVTRMEKELRPDLIASLSLETDTLPEIESTRDREVLRYIYQELTADERLVFEYTLGVNGKPELSAGNIAKTMGISQPKVSRIRRKIDKKLRARGV